MVQLVRFKLVKMKKSFIIRLWRKAVLHLMGYLTFIHLWLIYDKLQLLKYSLFSCEEHFLHVTLKLLNSSLKPSADHAIYLYSPHY